jgi:biotin operon repressor
MSGLTHVHIPVAIYGLGLKGLAEVSILALAASFGDNGLMMSNSALAGSLGLSRRSIITAIGKLKAMGLLHECGGRRGHRLVATRDFRAQAGEAAAPPQVKKLHPRGETSSPITERTEDKENTLSCGGGTFIAPTLEEVERYVTDKELCVDALSFHRYFTESGWVDSGGRKVRNWKQKAITWHSHGKGKRYGQQHNGIVRKFGDLTSEYGRTFGDRGAVSPMRMRSDDRSDKLSRLPGEENVHTLAGVLSGMLGEGTAAQGAKRTPQLSPQAPGGDGRPAEGAAAPGIPPRKAKVRQQATGCGASGGPPGDIPLGAGWNGKDLCHGRAGTPHHLHLRADVQASDIQRPAAGGAGELAPARRTE